MIDLEAARMNGMRRKMKGKDDEKMEILVSKQKRNQVKKNVIPAFRCSTSNEHHSIAGRI